MVALRRRSKAEVRKELFTRDVLSLAREPQGKLPPGWALHVDWAAFEKDIRDGHQLKRIWEEVAATRTSRLNFFKYVKHRFARLLTETVKLREFRAGEYCEVDYAGDKIDWLDRRTGEIHQAHIFVGILCFSQKIFAVAHEDEKKANWLDAHRRMFEFYGGVPAVLVPDWLNNGVVKSHRYDPDLNQDYGVRRGSCARPLSLVTPFELGRARNAASGRRRPRSMGSGLARST